MKNKGVIFSIIVILCTGVFLTNNTRRLILSSDSSAMTEEAYKNSASLGGGGQKETYEERLSDPESGAEQSEKALPPGDVPDMQAAAMAAEPMAAAVSEDEAAKAAPVGEETAPQAEAAGTTVRISPLTGSVEAAGEKDGNPLSGSEDYRKRFEELDVRIKKMKDSGIEPNTDTYKNMADYEYRLWDKELNSVYCGILDRMDAGEADALRADERDWLERRDQTAHKAISKYKGGTIESLEYIASLADSTRIRAYELLENYGHYLDLELAIDSNS